MAKNRITPKTEKALKELAARLPVPQKVGKVPVTGKELIDRNPDAKDSSGNPVDPKLNYFHSYPPAVNHLRRMRKAYEEGGNAAVNKYLKPYLKKEYSEPATS